MQKRLFLDIETLPPSEEDRARIEDEIERRRARNDSDGEVLRDIDEVFRELALVPEFGRILTIGVIYEEGGKIVNRGLFGRDRETMAFHMDEAKTLRSFWGFVRRLNLRSDLIVGHNVLDFDLPFIIKRSVIHGVRPSLQIPFRRFVSQPVFDTMWEWGLWRHKISLHTLALALGIASPKEDGINGSQIYDAWLEGRDRQIADYCLRDVECVREIFYRLNFEDLDAEEVDYQFESEVSADSDL